MSPSRIIDFPTSYSLQNADLRNNQNAGVASCSDKPAESQARPKASCGYELTNLSLPSVSSF